MIACRVRSSNATSFGSRRSAASCSAASALFSAALSAGTMPASRSPALMTRPGYSIMVLLELDIAEGVWRDKRPGWWILHSQHARLSARAEVLEPWGVQLMLTVARALVGNPELLNPTSRLHASLAVTRFRISTLPRRGPAARGRRRSAYRHWLGRFRRSRCPWPGSRDCFR